jgi:alpha-glucosidase
MNYKTTTVSPVGGSLNESLPAMDSWQRTPNGLLIQTALANIEISIYDHAVIRTNIFRNHVRPGKVSYAVHGQPKGIAFDIIEEPEKLVIQTAVLRLQILKNPVRFAYYNAEGRLLNTDDPAFGTSWIGTEVSTYKTMHADEKYIGMGEKTGNLNRRGKAYTHWNTDKFGYAADADPLYLSTPFFIGLREGLCYGIFMDNPHKSVVSFGASNNRFMYYSAADGNMDSYFFGGPSVADIIAQYSALTGTMEMPPLWSLGFQQCRYSYYPETEPLNAARTFREKDIPCDVIYLDIHYMDAYKVFTWHPTRFPNPKRLSDTLKSLGFSLVVILDPGIKTEKGYKSYEDALEQDLFVKYPDGNIYEGQVWPGWSAFPDFTNPNARSWWAEQIKFLADSGVEGFWNDMNEPAAWGQHLPDLIEFNFDGEGASHRKARNVYGMQMARATYEGGKKHLGKRPFVLTRAGFSGVQRYAAVWTGDNTSSDEHMLAGVRLVNAMGLAGIANAGYDIGGFAGECNATLFSRWIAIGAFSPFFRSHAMVNSRDSEPWTYGEEVEDISRNYIKLRYKLMPYLYSTFYEASQSGMPVQRSLAIDYYRDEKIFATAFQNQYLFGSSILVCPAESNKEYLKTYLPEGKWYDFLTDKKYEGSSEHLVELHRETLPLFVKAGSILPMQTVVSNLKLKPETTLDIHLYEGADAVFTYYEDDGESYDYLQGKYYKRKMIHKHSQHELCFDAAEGSLTSHFKEVRIFFHGFAGYKNSVRCNGAELPIQMEHISHMEPLSDFDPYHKPPKDRVVIMDINTVSVPFVKEGFSLTWG